MDPTTQPTTQQLLLYGVAFGAATGLVLGLIPLVVGLMKGKRRLAVLGFLVCLIGGAVAGLIISIPALIIFIWLIIRKTSGDPATLSDTEI